MYPENANIRMRISAWNNALKPSTPEARENEAENNMSPSFDELPQEILHVILAYACNKRMSNEERVELSGLNKARLVSRKFYIASQSARKEWISGQAVPLRRLGCINAQEAIEYVIHNQLEAVNLEDFPDIQDGHILRLMDRCPSLSCLLIKVTISEASWISESSRI